MDSQYSTEGQDASGRHYDNRHEGDDNSMEDLAVESDPVVPSSSLGAPTSTVRATSPMGMAMAPNGSEFRQRSIVLYPRLKLRIPSLQ
jgi:hypothetical protein